MCIFILAIEAKITSRLEKFQVIKAKNNIDFPSSFWHFLLRQNSKRTKSTQHIHKNLAKLACKPENSFIFWLKFRIAFKRTKFKLNWHYWIT